MGELERIAQELERSGKAGDVRALAESPEGQRLREMLDGEAIEKAAREGDSAALQGMLRQVLATQEGQTLAQRLRKVMEGK